MAFLSFPQRGNPLVLPFRGDGLAWPGNRDSQEGRQMMKSLDVLVAGKLVGRLLDKAPLVFVYSAGYAGR